MELESTPPHGTAHAGEKRDRPKHLRRWIILAAAVLLLVVVMREVLFPFRGQEYLEISHGDHSHYVPRERDPDVSISNFPTTPPGPDQRILPDGRVVPK